MKRLLCLLYQSVPYTVNVCFSACGGLLDSDWIVDPSGNRYYFWLFIVSLAVLYNTLFIIGRSVFWELQNASPPLWCALDYICDSIYVLDMVLRARTGKHIDLWTVPLDFVRRICYTEQIRILSFLSNNLICKNNLIPNRYIPL